MYHWILFVHILAAFVFAFIHGASSKVIFRLRREREASRIAALLDVSSDYLGWMYASLLVMLGAGIWLGYMGDWWQTIWIWLSLGLLVVMVPTMYFMATIPFNRVRKALGLPYFEMNKSHPAGEPASPEEIAASAAALKPWLIAGIGYVSLLVMLFLMVFKPF
ncbi:hypothetical protein ACFLTX_02590 [Chloroflexota bacterium]